MTINYNQPLQVEDTELLPKYDEVPAEFKDWNNRTRFNHLYNVWLTKGLPHDTMFIPKDGVNELAARKHIRTIMGDFTHTFEEKEAGCSYLLSLWFDDIILPEDIQHLRE